MKLSIGVLLAVSVMAQSAVIGIPSSELEPRGGIRLGSGLGRGIGRGGSGRGGGGNSSGGSDWHLPSWLGGDDEDDKKKDKGH